MIIIALGANLPSRFGDPAQTLLAARAAMDESGLRVVAESRIWLTAPVPLSDQPWYHNAVVAVETGLAPLAILERLQEIEYDFGRVRTSRNAPRLLDLDLVAYDDVIVDRPALIVPHPRMHERAFVLRPMAEIAPDWRHPVSGLTMDQMIAALPDDQQASPAGEAGERHAG